MLQLIEMRPLLDEQLRHIVTETLAKRSVVAPTDLFKQTMETAPALRSWVQEKLVPHFVARLLRTGSRWHRQSTRDDHS